MEYRNDVEAVRGLRIASYNCRSIKSSIDVVKQLCKKNDFVLLQEHWLLPGELGFLTNIDRVYGFW